MPRRVSRRRIVVAAVLVALAVVPNIVHVYVEYYPDVRALPSLPLFVRPVVHVAFLNRDRFQFSATVDQAHSVELWWHTYRRCWWALAALAVCIVIREFLPIPRVFGRDDE
jgi:hypothetical protein